MIRLRASFWPLAVFLLALVPRLAGLGAKSFWLDEAFTFHRASLAPAALVANSFKNHHMPAFFLLLSPFTALGSPQIWLRLPSALFGALAVMLVFLIARQGAGSLAGLLAALVFGLSPIALAFSQEARSYTLELCLVLIALWGVLQLVLQPDAAADQFLSRKARVGWLAYMLGTAAALDVLGDGLSWLLAAHLIFFSLLPMTARRGAWLRNIILADLVVVVLCAPFYGLMLHGQAMSPGAAFHWIPPLTWSRLWYSLGAVYLMRIPDWVTFHLMHVPTPAAFVWGIDGALLVALMLAIWHLRRHPARLAAVAIPAAFVPVLFAVISIWHPILLPRYIFWSAAPFAILVGIGAAWGLRACRPRVQFLALAVVGAVLLVNLLPYYQLQTKPRWDLAAKMLAQEVAPGDVIYLRDGYAKEILSIYFPVDKRSVLLPCVHGSLKKALQAQSQGARVWAVLGNAGQTANNMSLAEFRSKISGLGTPMRIQHAGQRIVILLYAPARAGP